MNEFISHIKMNPELATMFESVQRDTTMTTSETSLMDISWSTRYMRSHSSGI